MDQVIEFVTTNPYAHFVLVGFVVGILSRILMPGPDPMGIVKTALLGMCGSLLAGFLATNYNVSIPIPSPWGGYVMSLLGSFLLLLIFKVVRNVG